MKPRLDIELAGGQARFATIDYVYAQDVFTAVEYAIDTDLGPVISMSYGVCEQYDQGMLASGESLAQQANALGITWLAASGDSGAAGCDAPDESEATLGLAVSFPASIPEVTAVGGTEFAEGEYDWNTTNTYGLTSAISYLREVAWNDTEFGNPFGYGLWAGGGGASMYYPTPAWQAGPGFPNDGFRDVPDVSFSASAQHDGYLVCVEQCQGTLNIYGGTSASTPVFAGILAVLNQYLLDTGAQAQTGLGNINPAVYALAKKAPFAFHDVVSGGNMVPCIKGKPNCGTTEQLGYKAVAGYDQATGLGSIDVYSFLTSWITPQPPTFKLLMTNPGSQLQGMSLSYTLNLSNAGVGTASGPVTVSVSMSPGLTFIDIVGSVWNCGGNACTLNTTVIGGGAYPPLSIAGLLTSDAPATVTTTVTVAGGFAGSATASVTSNVIPIIADARTAYSASSSGCTPPPAQFAFFATDAQAVVWFQDNETAPTDRFAANWYGPSGSLYAAYTWPPPGTSGARCFSDTLNIAGSPPAAELGAWSVVVTRNGAPLFTLPFTILSATSYAISGQVTFAGNGFMGVGMTLNGSQEALAVTDVSGNYSLTASGGGTYTVTPGLPGYVFTPPNQVFHELAANQTANFSAQCAYSINPAAVYLDSGSQAGPTVSVTTAAGCAWTASASGFIVINSGASGTGNGTVTFSVPANISGAVQTGTLTIAGQTVAVTQRESADIFADVAPSDYYFDFANIMYQSGITSGCSTSPLDYCPDSGTTRAEMAVFLIAAIEHGNSFTYTTTPYFTDVRPSNPFFKFIQKLRDLGITSGCTATMYCPNGSVTREEMAVFIIVSRYGSTPYTYPSTPYFTDVPVSNPFFAFVQKMAEAGITAGCGGGLFCPNQTLTRGQMAVFIVTGLLNEMVSSPLIATAVPNTAAPGQSLTVTLTGVNTHFVQGTTLVVAAAGVTASNVVVLSGTSLQVQLAVGESVAPNPTSIVVLTGAEEAVLPNGFLVQ